MRTRYYKDGAPTELRQTHINKVANEKWYEPWGVRVLGDFFPPGWKRRLYGRQDARRYGAAIKARQISPASASFL